MFGYGNDTVIREVLHFMEENQGIIQQIKLVRLRQAVAMAADEADNGKLSPRPVMVLLLNQIAPHESYLSACPHC